MKEISRRDFLKKLSRALLLGGGTALVAKMAHNKQITFKKCISDSVCSRCSVNISCQLPQALSFRRVSK